jgi:hypothetical protein
MLCFVNIQLCNNRHGAQWATNFKFCKLLRTLQTLRKRSSNLEKLGSSHASENKVFVPHPSSSSIPADPETLLDTSWSLPQPKSWQTDRDL